MNFIPRDYQLAAKEAAFEYLRRNTGSPCIEIPTGGGKAWIIAMMCKDAFELWEGRVLILAHVKELLIQTVEKLTELAPEIPVGLYSAGLKQRDTAAPILVAGVQSVHDKGAALGHFDLVLIDECFPAGTRISTPLGNVAIESIRAGMFVSHAFGVGEVLATSARSATDLVTLEFSDGSTVTCTSGHPIFTNHGWIKAGQLEIGAMAYSFEDVQVLQKTISSLDKDAAERGNDRDEGRALEEAKFLFNLLLKEAQQPDVYRRASGEDARDNHQNKASAKGTRRERETIAQNSKATAGDFGRGLDFGICREAEHGPGERNAYALQTRHCEPDSETGNRDRRTLPWSQREAGAGQTENGVLGSKRVVRVTNHEQAGKTTVYNLHVSGHPSYFADGILAHNCHLIPESGDGMYRSLISDLIEINPDLRVIGLTATPYRLSSGPLCKPDGILNEICYSIGVKQLINRGYLSKLVSKAALKEIDTSLLKVVRGEFEAGTAEAAFDPVIDAAVGEILQATWNRRSTIIFCQSVAHAQRVVDAIRLRIENSYALAKEELKKHPFAPADGLEADVALLNSCRDWLEENDLPFTALAFYMQMGARRVGEIYGNTGADDRDQTIKQFKAGWIQYLANVNTLTTGFDAPATDCVVLLRATASPGLFYQMVGRGFRLAPGKENCLVLDFGKNIERHGPVDCLKTPHKNAKGQTSGALPAGKTCPECRSVMAMTVSVCLDCGHAFPMPEREPPRPGHDGSATNEDVISGEPKTSTHEVVAVNYRIHRKKGADENAPKTMRVEYQYGAYEFVSEWICVEHSGFARGKAELWWSKRCRYGCPNTAAEAVLMADSGLLAVPETITIRKKPGPKAFPEIVGCTVGDLPTEKSVCPRCQAVEERTYIPDPSGRFAGYLACGGCHYEYRKADPLEIETFGLEGVAVAKVELEKLPDSFEEVYAEDIPF